MNKTAILLVLFQIESTQSAQMETKSPDLQVFLQAAEKANPTVTEEEARYLLDAEKDVDKALKLLKLNSQMKNLPFHMREIVLKNHKNVPKVEKFECQDEDGRVIFNKGQDHEGHQVLMFEKRNRHTFYVARGRVQKDRVDKGRVVKGRVYDISWEENILDTDGRNADAIRVDYNYIGFTFPEERGRSPGHESQYLIGGTSSSTNVQSCTKEFYEQILVTKFHKESAKEIKEFYKYHNEKLYEIPEAIKTFDGLSAKKYLKYVNNPSHQQALLREKDLDDKQRTVLSKLREEPNPVISKDEDIYTAILKDPSAVFAVFEALGVPRP